MTDHIRDHNIVENNSPQPFQQADNFSVENLALMNQGQDEQLMREKLNNLKLAQLEEAAAVEEIQRVTSGTPEQFNNIINNNIKEQLQTAQRHQGAGTSSTHSSERDSSSRQSKLQRTCQNQNFYLFENEYPEARENSTFAVENNAKMSQNNPVGANVKGESRESPSRFYKNLFRESPDFILTTGGFVEQEAKRLLSSVSLLADSNNRQQEQLQRRQSSKQSSRDKDEMVEAGTQRLMSDDFQQSNDPYNNGDNTDADLAQATPIGTANKQNVECRVAKLNDDYQYVGSQSGHKYFVKIRP